MHKLPLAAALLALALPAGAQDKEIEDFAFDVTTVGGDRITEADFRDKVLLVDFWGTWCPPCRKAVPHLVALYDKYRDRGLAIVGLNYREGNDRSAAIAKVQRFAERNGITYPLALGSAEIRRQVPDFRGYPTLLFFRPGLAFDHLQVGFTEAHAAAIEDWVEQALTDRAGGPAKEGGSGQGGAKPAIAEPAPEAREFETAGGRKILVGDGKTHVLFVLVHPRAAPPADAIARLRERETKSGGRLRVVLATREDLEAGPGVLRFRQKDLGLMMLGKAFPAYRLFAPDGRRAYRDAGSGDRIFAGVEKALDEALAAPAPGAKQGGDKKPAKKPAAKQAVEKRAGSGRKG